MNTPKSINDARVGFIISHPFQFLFFRSLAERIPNSIVVIEKRKNTPFEFSDEFLESLPCSHIFLAEDRLRVLDDQFDLIFVLTPKHLSGRYRKAKVAALQYGMAKEYYNYGLWRARPDINFMFGDYSVEMIKGHAVAFAVGNTRFDLSAAASTESPGLLYLPTYGAISTIELFADAIEMADFQDPIFVKLHHAMEFENRDAIKRLQNASNVIIIDAYHDSFDLIRTSKSILTDYSGSMFDALFFGKPVTLFQPEENKEKLGFLDDSIEVSRGGDFGQVLRSKHELVTFIEKYSSATAPSDDTPNMDYYLSKSGDATNEIIRLSDLLLKGQVQRNVVQASIKRTVEELLTRPKKGFIPTPMYLLRLGIDRLLYG